MSKVNERRKQVLSILLEQDLHWKLKNARNSKSRLIEAKVNVNKIISRFILQKLK